MFTPFISKPEQWLKNQFEYFHQHPELSNLEFQTTARLKSILEQADIEILDLPLATGLVAMVGRGEGPVIAVRCDIDALPIEEETMLSYASRNSVCMHACGHDFHTTTVLGMALLLKQQEDKLQGRVKIIFQPAEEINKGANQVLDTAVLDDVEQIYGIHCSPALPCGTLGIKAGAVTAAVDRFSVKLLGRGGHAAMPNQSIDPITAASALVMNAQSIVSRTINPFNSAVLSFTRITSGQTWNIIPDSAFLEGTVRTHDPADREWIEQRLGDLASHIAAAHGLSSEFFWEAGPPAVINNPDSAGFAAAIAGLEGLTVTDPEESMIGEDFAFYLERIPGCFIMVGTGLSHALHNPKFQVDQKALYPTASYLAKLVTGYLANKE